MSTRRPTEPKFSRSLLFWNYLLPCKRTRNLTSRKESWFFSHSWPKYTKPRAGERCFNPRCTAQLIPRKLSIIGLISGQSLLQRSHLLRKEKGNEKTSSRFPDSDSFRSQTLCFRAAYDIRLSSVQWYMLVCVSMDPGLPLSLGETTPAPNRNGLLVCCSGYPIEPLYQVSAYWCKYPS